MSSIAAIFSAIGSFFSWMTGKSMQKNQPDVKLAAKGQDDATEASKDADAIAAKDADRVRQEIAE